MTTVMELTSAEQERWLRVLGDRVAPFPDRTLLEISHDDWGNAVVDALSYRALYLVVDPDNEVVYVGKVDRVEGSVADRFRHHHACNDEWDRVWVVTLVDELSSHDVSDIELSLIHHFDPVDNRNGRGNGAAW